jgi:hypothetical protein
MANHSDLLRRLNACSEAREWYEGQDSQQAWLDCARGDWLLWIAARLDVDRTLIVLAACDCAELALRHVPAGEDRPRAAIDTARSWARGEATIEAVRAAAYAADAAADAAYAADAAADAAYAAADAAYAAHAAYVAAYAAADAAHAARAADAAYAAELRRCAELVRRRISWDVIETAIAARAAGWV